MSERKGETKRQHYVPRFILRNFSRDEKNTSILILKNGRLVESGPLKKQCYEDYFYGEDQIMEKSFADGEARMSAILRDLSTEHLERLTDDDIFQVKLFVHYQMGRTRAAVEQMTEFMSAMVRQAAAETARMNNESVDLEALNQVKLVHSNAVNESIWLSAKSTPVVRDLAVKFLKTSRQGGFVIADHPVVAMNPFAEHHPLLSLRPNITAPVAKGIQLFMPLSSTTTVVLYDPTTYEFDSPRRVCNVGPRDVLLLNIAQAVNSWGCVFFDSERIDERAIQKLVDVKLRHKNVHKSEVLAGEVRDEAEGQRRQLIATFRNDVRVGARFSFLRVTDKGLYLNYDGAGAPVRSEYLYELLEGYDDLLERVVDLRRQKKAEGTLGVQITEEEVWQQALATVAARRAG